MQEILFLEPIFKERIWGGDQLKQVYGYPIPSDKTGECWGISAHRNGDCRIKNGVLKGRTLSDVYEHHRELFDDCSSPRFPLLTKILDASADLSVQVHPDNEYARKHADDLGKTECWYIIDCAPGATLIYGHHASTREELIDWIENNEWDQLLRKVEIQPGDFFYVPTGTLHALCKGTLVLESQQSSDTTYRVYDYDRVDDQGNRRPLHLKEAIDVLTVPHEDPKLDRKTWMVGESSFTRYVKSDFFTLEKWNIRGNYRTSLDQFILVTVLDGAGTVNDEGIQKGDHFIVTSACDSLNLFGEMELMISHL